MQRKLIAALPCRNNGSRLYGKPLQNLDIEKGLTVLDYIISYLKNMPIIDGIVLGISEGEDNLVYKSVAKKHDISFIVGSEKDVLYRLIQCGEHHDATDVYRMSTESPFPYFEIVDLAWSNHKKNNFDFTHLDNVPDGSGIEIISMDTLHKSHSNGEDRHRSEFCSLYIRENREKFKIQPLKAPKEVLRADIRLTVDYPEDLIICRAVFNEFKDLAPLIPLNKIINFLDSNKKLKDLVNPFVEEGLKSMYL